MSIIMIAIFLLFSLIAFALNRPRPGFFNLIMALILIFIIGTGVLPKMTVNALQDQNPVTDPQWKSENAIIVLGAGTSLSKTGKVQAHILAYARLLESLRLYNSCKKQKVVCRVYLSGGDPAQNGITEAQLMQETLVEAGVQLVDIVREDKSNNTFQNAQFTADLFKDKMPEQMYLVTSGIHMSRALKYFAHFDLNPIPAPADSLQAIIAPFPIAPNFTFFDASMHEWLGLLRYNIYNLLGWNPVVTRPGSV